LNNYFRTFLLIAAMTGLFLAVGYLIGGQSGMLIAFGLAVAMNLFAYWNSDKMVLRMYGAREVDRNTAPQFYGIVEQLAQRAGLPMPRVFVMQNDQPNAFATGRNPQNAAVAATTGLLQKLSAEEIAGVMAHFAMFFGGSRDSNGNANPLGLIGSLALMILAPLGAMLVQMAISRSREYEADRIGAEISGKPLWLASALGNLHNAAQVVPNEEAERNPATAHMFIVNPLQGRGADSLFSTHPNMENRIARLRAMAGQGTVAPRRGPWG